MPSRRDPRKAHPDVNRDVASLCAAITYLNEVGKLLTGHGFPPSSILSSGLSALLFTCHLSALPHMYASLLAVIYQMDAPSRLALSTQCTEVVSPTSKSRAFIFIGRIEVRTEDFRLSSILETLPTARNYPRWNGRCPTNRERRRAAKRANINGLAHGRSHRGARHGCTRKKCMTCRAPLSRIRDSHSLLQLAEGLVGTTGVDGQIEHVMLEKSDEMFVLLNQFLEDVTIG